MVHVSHEEFNRNGVKVKVTEFRDVHGASLGRTVEADCLCYGIPFRTHSIENCPTRVQSSVSK